MAINLALNDRVIGDAVKLGGHQTKREALNAALEAYVKSKRRLGLLELFGNVESAPGYDHKLARRRGSKRIMKG